MESTSIFHSTGGLNDGSFLYCSISELANTGRKVAESMKIADPFTNLTLNEPLIFTYLAMGGNRPGIFVVQYCLARVLTLHRTTQIDAVVLAVFQGSSPFIACRKLVSSNG